MKNSTTKLEQKNLKEFLKDGRMLLLANNNDECEVWLRNEPKNSWANGYKINFNGIIFTFKTFSAFLKKYNQLQTDFNLELINKVPA